MTLVRGKDELTVMCDECEGEDYAGTLEFSDFIQYLREQGWRMHKEGDVWLHYCPRCEGGGWPDVAKREPEGW